jgi:hypothetical protein
VFAIAIYSIIQTLIIMKLAKNTNSQGVGAQGYGKKSIHANPSVVSKKIITPPTTAAAKPGRVVPKGIIDGFEVTEEMLVTSDPIKRMAAEMLIARGFWKLKKRIDNHDETCEQN